MLLLGKDRVGDGVDIVTDFSTASLGKRRRGSVLERARTGIGRPLGDISNEIRCQHSVRQRDFWGGCAR